MKWVLSLTVVTLAVVIAGVTYAAQNDADRGIAVASWGFLQTRIQPTEIMDTIRDYQVDKGWQLNGESGAEAGAATARFQMRGTAPNDVSVKFDIIVEKDLAPLVRVVSDDANMVSEVTTDL